MNLLLLASACVLLTAAFLRPFGRRTRKVTIEAAAIAAALATVVALGLSGLWQALAVVAGALILLASTAVGRHPSRSRLRAATRAGFVGLLVLLAAGLATSSFLFPLFELPAPTGAHSVGVMQFLAVDSARSEVLTQDPDDLRHIPLTVWYPAGTQGIADREPVRYWPDPELRAGTLAGGLGLPGVVFSHLDRIRTHAVLDAEPAWDASPPPVLLFSHGYGGATDQSTFLMEDLASHGYMVVSVGHPYESLPVRLGNEVADFRPQTPEATGDFVDESLRAMGALAESDADGRRGHEALLRQIGAMTGLDESFGVWVADGHFALDWIEAALGPGGPFEREPGEVRIGVFGHSFGGALAGELCRTDPRCVAGINLDGAQMGDVVDEGLSVPFLFVYSEPTTWINHSVVGISSSAAQATVTGSAHLDFTDLPSMTPLLGLLSRVMPIPQAGPIDREEMVASTRTVVRGFFDAYVREAGSDLPEASALPAVRFELPIRLDRGPLP